MDGVCIYVQNVICKYNEQFNYFCLFFCLDVVVVQFNMQSKMQIIFKFMGFIVKVFDSFFVLGNMEKILQIMDQFEKMFVNMEVQLEFIEIVMVGSMSLLILEDEVNLFIN